MSDVPASPKLLRLEAEIKETNDPRRKGCLTAERAGFLGRQGYFHAARTAIAKLQTEFAVNPDAKVSAWIQIAEAWIAHYEYLPDVALDRMRRAYALSTAASLDDLKALSAAWLAHFSYNRDQISDMARYLRVAREFAKEENYSAQSRMSLVFALAHHYVGDFNSAEPWYKKARNCASYENDEAALSTISYNMTYRRTYHLFVASIMGHEWPIDWSLAGVGIETNRNYESLLKISSVGAWGAMVEVMFCSATARFGRAIELYDENIDKFSTSGLLHQKAAFVADLAWCLVNVNNVSRAQVEADKAATEIEWSSNIEDRVLISGRLAQVYAALGKTKQASIYREAANTDFNSLLEFRSEMSSVLSDLG